MNVRSSAAAVICLAALFAQATETEIKDNIEIPAEGKTIDVASGDTTTYSGVLSGSGKITKTGAGTLVLSGNNTFSGGLTFSTGAVRVDREGALGTGKVIVGTGAGGLFFNASGASFANEIEKYDGSTLFLHFMKDTTLTGYIRSEYNCDPAVNVDSGVTVVFDGNVNGRHNSNRGWQLNAIGGGTVIFKKNLTMAALHDWGNGKNNADSTVELWGTGNYFYGTGSGGGGFEFGGISYICRAENVLNGAVLNRARNRSYKSELDLDGNDQTVWGFTYNTGDTAWSDAKGGTITTPADKPATLTVTGTGADRTDSCNFEINGAVSLVLDADPTYVLSCIHRISKTTGSLTVTSGTLEIGGSSTTFKNVPSIAVGEQGAFRLTTNGAGALSGLETLSVAGGGSFTVTSTPPTPFTAEKVNVSLETGASLTLPENMSLVVASLTVGGNEMPSGTYTPANCDEIKSGSLIVLGKTVAASWTGAAADTRISSPENWNASSPFSFENDQLEATFAENGTEAVIDVPVSFTTIGLTATNFSFIAADGDKMSVSGGIAVQPIEGDPPRQFDFAAPLAFTQEQTLGVPEGSTFTFSNLYSPDKVKLTKDGAGTLVFEGTNVFDGRLNVSAGRSVISGVLTTSTGTVDLDPTHDISLDQALYFGGNTAKKLVLSGATIGKPLVFAHPANDYSSLTIAPDTTNYLYSALKNADFSAQGFYMGSNSVLVCSGGVQQIVPWFISGSGTWIIRDKPIYWYSSGKNKWLEFNAGSDLPQRIRLVIETPHNKHKFRFYEYGGTLDCRVNDAFDAGSRLKMDARWNGYSYLELHSTTQRFDTVDIRFSGLASDYAFGRCEVHGDAGAAIGIRSRADATVGDPNDINSLIDAPIVGNVSILKEGEGTLTMTNRAFASTGDLVISGGTLRFAENADPAQNASWLNGTNVFVKGTGRLELSTTAVFNRKFAQLHLADDGVIAIPSGTTAKFKHVTVDGIEIQPGAYTYATAPADLKKHMTADSGTLVSKGDGLMLIVR